MSRKRSQRSLSLALAYGAEHQRYKMCNPNCSSPTATTLYLNDPVTGAMSEKAAAGASTTWRDYIIAGGQIVAVRSSSSGAASWQYVVPDQLTSVTNITQDGSSTVERNSEACPLARGTRGQGDAWGKRRNPDATDDPACTLSSTIPRGFTDHEMLVPFCLINMNARIYDPGLGSFLSPDSIVPNPFSFKGYQRYAYLNSNPLNAIDPSGYHTYDPHPCWGCIRLIGGADISTVEGFSSDGEGGWYRVDYGVQVIEGGQAGPTNWGHEWFYTGVFGNQPEPTIDLRNESGGGADARDESKNQNSPFGQQCTAQDVAIAQQAYDQSGNVALAGTLVLAGAWGLSQFTPIGWASDLVGMGTLVGEYLTLGGGAGQLASGAYLGERTGNPGPVTSAAFGLTAGRVAAAYNNTSRVASELAGSATQAAADLAAANSNHTGCGH